MKNKNQSLCVAYRNNEFVVLILRSFHSDNSRHGGTPFEIRIILHHAPELHVWNPQFETNRAPLHTGTPCHPALWDPRLIVAARVLTVVGIEAPRVVRHGRSGTHWES